MPVNTWPRQSKTAQSRCSYCGPIAASIVHHWSLTYSSRPPPRYRGRAVLSPDNDFELIAQITGQPIERLRLTT